MNKGLTPGPYTCRSFLAPVPSPLGSYYRADEASASRPAFLSLQAQARKAPGTNARKILVQMSYIFPVPLDGKMRPRSDPPGFARVKEIAVMRRIKSVFAVAAVAVTMLVASIPPAVAASPAALILFAVPGGPGGTYSCTSGPPFVSKLDSPQENCTLYQTGAPTGLVCDIPTTVTFVPTVPEVPEVGEYVANASLCH